MVVIKIFKLICASMQQQHTNSLQKESYKSTPVS